MIRAPAIIAAIVAIAAECEIDIPELAAFVPSGHKVPPTDPGRRCANNGDQPEWKCRSNAVPGHIYCKPCRLATGGYDRYNPPRRKTA